MSNVSWLRPGWRESQRTVNGVRLHVVEAGPADGPLLILLHGFLEFWWAWRHRIDPLAQRRNRHNSFACSMFARG